MYRALILRRLESTTAANLDFLKNFPASVNTPLNATQLQDLLNYTKEHVPVTKVDGPRLHKLVTIDTTYTPFWINNKEEYLGKSSLKKSVAEAKRIWKETGFNYFCFFSQFGLIKYRLPFLAIFNPFNQMIEIFPDDSKYANEYSKRNRDRVFSLINTYRSKLTNTIVGGEFRYKRRLKLVGMGMKVASVYAHPKFPNQKVMDLQLGRSHMIPFALPPAVQVKLLNKRGTGFRLFSTDYEMLQTTTAEIRKLKPPEVYTGKGIVFPGEEVKRKEGKKK